MALIKDAKGRLEGSGYSRLFDDNDLGYLISRVQSAVISAGTELERLIKNKVQTISDLDEFLKQRDMPDGVRVADKKEAKKCKTLNFSGAEPDFMIFEHRPDEQVCHLVELKDGDSFDTKKAAAERQAMHSFIDKNARYMPYTVEAHFCCFNQDNKQAIFDGFKRQIELSEAMTGQEFCDLLELNYMEIVQMRAQQGPENARYFLKELIGIDSARKILKEDLGILFPK